MTLMAVPALVGRTDVPYMVTVARATESSIRRLYRHHHLRRAVDKVSVKISQSHGVSVTHKDVGRYTIYVSFR